jgi:DNA-binding transcriptional ArsR family regulator
MSLPSPIVVLLPCAVACVVLLAFTQAIMGRHAGSVSRAQRARVVLFSVLYLSAIGSSVLAFSLQWVHTDVHVERHYQDPVADQDALVTVETFNYGTFMNPVQFANESIFPPYPYRDHLELFSNEYQPWSVSYVANITRPAATVNISSTVSAWGGLYQLREIWSLANGTWGRLNDTGSLLVGVEWFVEVKYREDGLSRFSEIVMVIGVNATRGVIFVARGIYLEIPIVDFMPCWVCYLIPVAFFLVCQAMVLEASRAAAPFKRPPRHVTAENLMENDTRVAVVEAVRDNPGITFSGLLRIVRRSPRTMLEQLGVLQRFGIVRAREIRHNTAFFDGAASEERDVLDYFSSHDKFQALLQAIKDAPGITFIALQRRLVEPRSTLMRKVKILEQHGVVKLAREAGQFVSIEIDAGARRVG